MTKIQNPKPVLVIEYWNLGFICNLVLGAWDFLYSITPKNVDLENKLSLLFRVCPTLTTSSHSLPVLP